MESFEPRGVLERLGRPAIVVVDLDPALLDPKLLMGRLMAAFVGARRGTATSAAVQIRQPIPGRGCRRHLAAGLPGLRRPRPAASVALSVLRRGSLLPSKP